MYELDACVLKEASGFSPWRRRLEVPPATKAMAGRAPIRIMATRLTLRYGSASAANASCPCYSAPIPLLRRSWCARRVRDAWQRWRGKCAQTRRHSAREYAKSPGAIMPTPGSGTSRSGSYSNVRSRDALFAHHGSASHPRLRPSPSPSAPSSHKEQNNPGATLAPPSSRRCLLPACNSRSLCLRDTSCWHDCPCYRPAATPNAPSILYTWVGLQEAFSAPHAWVMSQRVTCVRHGQGQGLQRSNFEDLR